MAKTDTKEIVTAVTPVLFDGENYAPGEQIEVPESQAIALAACGAVARAPAAPKAAKPKTPAEPPKA